MKKTAAILMALALFAAPLTLAAEEAKSQSEAADEAAPALPKTEDLKEAAPEAAEGAKAEVEVPEGEPEVKKENVGVVQKKYGHFRWGNFLLGALGGAALVTGIGIPSGAANGAPGAGLDGSKIALLAGCGAVGGGLLSVLLGATSPLPITPPDMSQAPLRPYAASPKQLVFSMQF